jgi:hypothetical protein
MPVATRSSRLRRVPPPLYRTTALARVQFTPSGRALARRLMFPPEATAHYYRTSLDGVSTHHFLFSDGETRHAPVCPEVEYLSP